MPKLFDLFVDLVLNAGTFEEDLTDIKTEAQSIAEEIDSLNQAPEGVTQTKLSNVIGDAASVKDNITDAKKAADDVDVQIGNIETTGSTVLGGLMDTFAGVAGMLIESVVAGIFEVGAESIEMAAAADSPLAAAYNKASESLTLTQDLAKMEIGNALLPVATSIKQLTDNILSFVFNISDADKLTAYLDQLETYEADNLERVSANLQSVFKSFEQINRAQATDFASLSAGVVSQTRFWTDYADTLDKLKARGVDSQFLADIADGSYESLEQLMSLEDLSDEDLQTFMASYEQLNAARAAAAESINDVQVDVELATDNVENTIAEMVTHLDQSEIASINMSATADSIVSVLADSYPVIAGQVDAINAKISELGSAKPAYTSPELQQAYMTGASPYAFVPAEVYAPKASGMPYVPYDGYKAELHRGEGVLTRQENEERLNGKGGTGSISPAMLEDALFGALSRWGQPVGSNAFGAIIAPQVSRSIVNGTKGGR